MKKYLFGLGLLASLICQGQPNYSNSLQREDLGRGVVAVRQSAGEVFVSWRYLSADPEKTAFVVYRDGKRITPKQVKEATCFVDAYAGNEAAVYEVRPLLKGKETDAKVGSYTLPAQAPIGYVDIPLDKPANGTTPDGRSYGYTANDASIGDVDGDGEYEIILQWEPTNAHDNAHDGYTGNVLFDCYRLTGEKLWRIDLGPNIRAGAHYTQFMVYDLDGDGKAEVVMKTSDGTVDGQGQVIGDAFADYREKGDTARVETQERQPQLPDSVLRKVEQMRRQWEQRTPGQEGQRPEWTGNRNRQPAPRMPMARNQGRILKGNEFLTVFSGLTGEALKTIDYVPERGNLADWGDNRGNRSERYLACVAYLDGIHPSVVMCRGYYTRAVLAAFDWDGKDLKQHWVFDSAIPEWRSYSGQGNHNLRVGDVDGDGCDEIVYGSCTIDHNGKGLYSTRMGHGDALHMTGFIPGEKNLQVWACHENKKDGSTFRDAATGEVLFRIPSGGDVGRCMAADIDPRYPGVEMWSSDSKGIRSIKGEVVQEQVRGLSCNMAVWWDGDLLRELLDGTRISKYNWETGTCETLANFDECERNNGSKSNPCLQGDMLGDWREEVLLRTKDNQSLRLYVSTIPTNYRFHTFLEDPIYRISIATQNVAYNQPTQPGFYFGPALKGSFRGTELK